MDAASVRLDDLAADVEAEPRATVLALDGRTALVELLPDHCQTVMGDADARVLHIHHHRVVRGTQPARQASGKKKRTRGVCQAPEPHLSRMVTAPL